MRPWPRTPVLGALWCFAALTLVGLVVHRSDRAQDLDADVLELTTRIRTRLRLDEAIEAFVHLGDPVPYVLAAAAVVVYAAVHGHRRPAAALAVALVAAPMTAEILKVLTAQPRPHSVEFAARIADRSWPSGHTTGAATLALAAVAVAPPRLRVLVALGGGLYALAMGFTVVALVSHFPSDALGAYLLSAGWVLLALAAARLPQRL